MTLLCPRCHSSQVIARNHARKVGGTIGAIAGAAGSFANALKGAEVGQKLGWLGGPAGMAVGTIAGAIVGGLFGGATGCSAGIALGQLIDDNVLRGYRCINCGLTFSRASFNSSGSSATGPESFKSQQAHDFPACDADEHLD